MIYADAELSDGMYNINNGKLFKYKAKGGSVRVHEIKRLVRCGECKHMMPDGRCELFADDAIRPSVSDFCSYGERGEE